jgi:cytochrome c-type biogenesis protein CcmH/NrfG
MMLCPKCGHDVPDSTPCPCGNAGDGVPCDAAAPPADALLERCANIYTMLRNGSAAMALTQCRALVAEYPDRDEGWLLLGDSAKADGNFDEAIAAYRQVISLNGSCKALAQTRLDEVLDLGHGKASLSATAGATPTVVTSSGLSFPSQPKRPPQEEIPASTVSPKLAVLLMVLAICLLSAVIYLRLHARSQIYQAPPPGMADLISRTPATDHFASLFIPS